MKRRPICRRPPGGQGNAAATAGGAEIFAGRQAATPADTGCPDGGAAEMGWREETLGVDAALLGLAEETLPLRNETLPCPNETLPPRDGTLPPRDETLPPGNETLPGRNETLPLRGAISGEHKARTPPGDPLMPGPAGGVGGGPAAGRQPLATSWPAERSISWAVDSIRVCISYWRAREIIDTICSTTLTLLPSR